MLLKINDGCLDLSNLNMKLISGFVRQCLADYYFILIAKLHENVLIGQRNYIKRGQKLFLFKIAIIRKGV